MSQSEGPKTIWAYKIRGTRKTKEVFWSIFFLISFFVLATGVALLQYHICSAKNPNISFRECMSGITSIKGEK